MTFCVCFKFLLLLLKNKSVVIRIIQKTISSVLEKGTLFIIATAFRRQQKQNSRPKGRAE